jgi:hypothetical protein
MLSQMLSNTKNVSTDGRYSYRLRHVRFYFIFALSQLVFGLATLTLQIIQISLAHSTYYVSLILGGLYIINGVNTLFLLRRRLRCLLVTVVLTSGGAAFLLLVLAAPLELMPIITPADAGTVVSSPSNYILLSVHIVQFVINLIGLGCACHDMCSCCHNSFASSHHTMSIYNPNGAPDVANNGKSAAAAGGVIGGYTVATVPGLDMEALLQTSENNPNVVPRV